MATRPTSASGSTGAGATPRSDAKHQSSWIAKAAAIVRAGLEQDLGGTMLWQLRGACRGLPVEIFFPPEGLRGRKLWHREDLAKRICRSCPVIDSCRAHALDTAEPYGIWGATTPMERRRLTQARMRTRTSMAPVVADALPSRGI